VARVFARDPVVLASDVRALDLRAADTETVACHLLRDSVITEATWERVVTRAWDHRLALDEVVTTLRAQGEAVPEEWRVEMASLLRQLGVNSTLLEQATDRARTNPALALSAAEEPIQIGLVHSRTTYVQVNSAVPAQGQVAADLRALRSAIAELRDQIARGDSAVASLVKSSNAELAGLPYRAVIDSTAVVFAFDSDSLDDEALDTLRTWVGSRAVEGRDWIDDPGVSFSLVAYTDSSGPSHYNRDLAERRADAVAKALVETLGLAPLRLATIAVGATDRFGAGAASRRVMVYAHRLPVRR
jgi:outer membrane protein OmpA-like peptidoglycan-associated protein